MREQTKRALIESIRNNPAIGGAAETGSTARAAGADRFSDLDVLVVARDPEQVSDVRAWLPDAPRMLICASHLVHYYSVLFDTFEKLDLAIFSVHDPPSRWVLQDYKVIRGDDDFEDHLSDAARATRERTAAHLDPDVSIDNILLLLVTAQHRLERGEELSAYGMLTAACDMMISLETRRSGTKAETDLLDARRRLERLEPSLAAAMHSCLFAPPIDGIARLAGSLDTFCHAELTDDQRTVIDHLTADTSD